MRKLLFLVLIFAPLVVGAQTQGPATMVLYPGVPTGTCSARQMAINQATGQLYTCFGAGATTTGTWQVVSGGGGPVTLNGCTNPPGSIACNISLTGGSGPPGLFTIPYITGTTGTGLPTPPATPQAGIASDGTGHLYSSTGNGAAFTPIASVAGVGTGYTGTNIYTTSTPNSTFTADTGKLVLMNCAAACFYELFANGGSTTWHITLMSIGTVNANLTLQPGINFNGPGSFSAPPGYTLQRFQPINVYADSSSGLTYWASSGIYAGVGIGFGAANGGTTGGAGYVICTPAPCPAPISAGAPASGEIRESIVSRQMQRRILALEVEVKKMKLEHKQ
jgi:hypothetical protein